MISSKEPPLKRRPVKSILLNIKIKTLKEINIKENFTNLDLE